MKFGIPEKLKINEGHLGREGAAEEEPQNLHTHFPSVLG